MQSFCQEKGLLAIKQFENDFLLFSRERKLAKLIFAKSPDVLYHIHEEAENRLQMIYSLETMAKGLLRS